MLQWIHPLQPISLNGNFPRQQQGPSRHRYCLTLHVPTLDSLFPSLQQFPKASPVSLPYQINTNFSNSTLYPNIILWTYPLDYILGQSTSKAVSQTSKCVSSPDKHQDHSQVTLLGRQKDNQTHQANFGLSSGRGEDIWSDCRPCTPVESFLRNNRRKEL